MFVQSVVRIARVVAGALVLGVLVAGSGGGAVPQTAVAQQAGGAAQLQALAERLLTPPYYAFGTQIAPPAAHLFPGRLPPDAPLDVPIPTGGRLVGSMQSTGGPPGASTVVAVVDAPGAPAEVQRFYDQALGARGWSPPDYRAYGPYGPGAGGFQQAFSPAGGFYCQDGSNGYATLTISPSSSGASGMSDVRVSVSLPSAATTPGTTAPYGGPCSPPPGLGSGQLLVPPRSPLPPLLAPPGARLQLTGQTGGASSWNSEAVAQTDLPSTDLEAYFESQLSDAGWSWLDSGSGGPLAWSAWALPDEGDWQGLLFVLELQGENRRALSLRADSASSEFGPVFTPGSYVYPAYPLVAPPVGAGPPVSAAPPAAPPASVDSSSQ